MAVVSAFRTAAHGSLLIFQRPQIRSSSASSLMGLTWFFWLQLPTRSISSRPRKLQYHCNGLMSASSPFEDIQTILQEELGRPIDSVYEYVDQTSIASASITQAKAGGGGGGGRRRGAFKGTQMRERKLAEMIKSKVVEAKEACGGDNKD
ncbi:hypothetical protein RJ639_041890 [Escallonia herrerae]|uniref:ABC1 atypical kinase-like domain-containing protein n=1 Tax=Escallonia herrerae TaxID=1293975 RepID=A0AA89B5H6_9ASTE|nr:hypothetical protein RJ639_041890 [Escallonia herrerae]